MRFAIITEGRYLRQRMPGALVTALLQSGHKADIICSDDEVCDFPSHVPPFEAYDCVISRDRSLIGLFLLACAERAGIPTVNSRAAIEGVRNKAEMTATLVAAGIPMPDTVACRSPAQLRCLPDSFFPLVIKPNFGDNGNGVQLVSRHDIPRIKPGDPSLVLAQRFVPNDGFDLKLYVAGQRIWAVRKPNVWSSQESGSAISPVPVDEEARFLAFQCGAALGLEVYGVDTLPGPDGIQVLEVNEFPNFSGIAEAPQAVADVLVASVGERRVEAAGLEPRIPERRSR